MKTDTPSHDPTGANEVVVQPKEKSDGSDSDAPGVDVVQEEEEQNPPPAAKKFTFPSSLAWIPQNMTWSKLKVVIRCSLTAWVSVVLMIIRPVSRPLGQVSINAPLSSSDEGSRSSIRLASSLFSVINIFASTRSSSNARYCSGSFLSPPQGPFISVLERELYMVFFTTVSWA